MKKKVMLVFMLLFLTGCSIENINEMSVEECSDAITKSDVNLYNVNKIGYRYYLPRGFTVVNDIEYNETLMSNGNKYYMYIDIVSYYNRTRPNFENNPNAFVSKEINNRNGNGYLLINKKNDKFFIEMMYNYAKIEVLVDEKDMKSAITNISYILASVKYNRNVIQNMLDENTIDFKEKKYKITKPNKEEEVKNILDYAKEYDKYTEENSDLKDTDMIDG